MQVVDTGNKRGLLPGCEVWLRGHGWLRSQNLDEVFDIPDVLPAQFPLFQPLPVSPLAPLGWLDGLDEPLRLLLSSHLFHHEPSLGHMSLGSISNQKHHSMSQWRCSYTTGLDYHPHLGDVWIKVQETVVVSSITYTDIHIKPTGC